jgi:hypothetical protein
LLIVITEHLFTDDEMTKLPIKTAKKLILEGSWAKYVEMMANGNQIHSTASLGDSIG